MKKINDISNNKALNALMVNYISKKDMISCDLSILMTRMIIFGDVSIEQFEAKLDELSKLYIKIDCIERFTSEDFNFGEDKLSGVAQKKVSGPENAK